MKNHAIAGGILASILSLPFLWAFVAKTTIPTPSPSPASTFTVSGKTRDQVKAEEIRDGIRTQLVHSTKVAGNVTLVNSLFYKDPGNLVSVVPSSLLPNDVKGTVLKTRGTLITHPKYGEQWMVTEVLNTK